jgi:hypothetical protein
VPPAVALRTGAVEDAAVQHPPVLRLPINAVSAMGKEAISLGRRLSENSGSTTHDPSRHRAPEPVIRVMAGRRRNALRPSSRISSKR